MRGRGESSFTPTKKGGVESLSHAECGEIQGFDVVLMEVLTML